DALASAAGLGTGEPLVVDTGDVPALRADVAAQVDTLGLRGRRQVEGTRHGDAPVEEEGAVALLADVETHTADVAAVELRRTRDGVLRLDGGVLDVDAAEDQAQLGEVETVELQIGRAHV